MRELIEFRINNDYAHLLLTQGEGKRNGSNTIIHITKDDSKFDQELDLFASAQKIGVRRGLLRLEPLYLCSTAFWENDDRGKIKRMRF